MNIEILPVVRCQWSGFRFFIDKSARGVAYRSHALVLGLWVIRWRVWIIEMEAQDET